MPYVFYDELPEGLEAAEVVEQANYDALADELAGVISQRDEALEHLEEARKETRAAKSKYADLILNSGPKDGKKADPKPDDRPKGVTIKSLFE